MGNNMSINQITGGATSVPGVGAASDQRAVPQVTSQKSHSSTAIAKANATGEVSQTELKKSVDKINNFINGNNAVNFNLDQGSGKVVVQIVDRETNKVIRQIPSAEVLAIAKDLDGKKGILLNAQA
jgi:flagellar protein FlaG